MTGQIFNRAVQLHQAGRLVEAEGLYRQALGVTRDDPNLNYLHGAVLFQLQRLPEALKAAEAALALAPAAAEILVLHGVLLRSFGRLNEALVSVDRALAQAPGLADALSNRALILWDLNRMEAALEALDRLIAVDPEAADPWVRRAMALFRLGRTAEAGQSAETALDRRPEHPAAWSVRGQALLRLGRFADALASLDRSLAAAPDQEDVRQARGEALLGLDRPAEALEVFQGVLDRRPDSADALAARAVALACLRRFEAATADFEAALRLAPARPDIWFKSAATLIVQQRFDEALDALDRTLALDPAYPGARFKRGEVLCEAGRIAEGMDQIADWARQVYAEGAAPMEEPVRSPEAKQRHDGEQRAWLAARGVATIRGLHIDGGDRVSGPAVNLANREPVAGQWAASDPKVVVIDQLLTPPALEGLRRFCRGSTVWRRSYRQGYLGAFPEHGFACPLLAQIAEELREVFPTVLGGHGLLVAWAFKYDSRLGGILTHADPAAANVNFWITPEESNLDPHSGGMVVWDAVPPPEWEFRRANGDSAAIKAFLEGAGARATTVPYRENRAVVFDSNLFHKTDRIDFREGYEHRRINVTMLYGRRNFYNV